MNLYPAEVTLVLPDGSTMLSREGSTQGCALGMAQFAIGSLPIIDSLRSSGAYQSWYADDLLGAGRVTSVLPLIRTLRHDKPCNYTLNLSKTSSS